MTPFAERRRAAQWCAGAAIALCGFAPAAAQSGPPLLIDEMREGDCQIVVRTPGAHAGDRVGVALDASEFRQQSVAGPNEPLLFSLGAPLRAGMVAQARLNNDEATAAVAVPPIRGSSPRGTCHASQIRDETPLFASMFVGVVSDAIGLGTATDYANPDDVSMKYRWLLGVATDYRLVGSVDSRVQLWLNAQTIHGMRTADISCASSRAAACSDVAGKTATRVVLANASSLEAYVSPRLDFLPIGRASSTPVSLYTTARIGFMALAGAPSVFSSVSLAGGYTAINGKFAGSYTEIGYGKNELYSSTWSRIRLDSMLSVSLEDFGGVAFGPRLFLEVMVDRDVRGGADNVRTFIGYGIDITRIFRP
jgi:hypothetical protein